MSKDQNYVCFPRFSTIDRKQAQENIIDLYDCSGPNGEFWMSTELVDIKDSFYRFSIKMPQSDVKNFFRIVFSTTSKYMCILSKRFAYIFDTTSEVTSTDEDGTRHLEPVHTFSIKNQTYDRVLGLYLREDNFDSSWVILQSSQYGQIHLLPIFSVLEN